MAGWNQSSFTSSLTNLWRWFNILRIFSSPVTIKWWQEEGVILWHSISFTFILVLHDQNFLHMLLMMSVDDMIWLLSTWTECPRSSYFHDNWSRRCHRNVQLAFQAWVLNVFARHWSRCWCWIAPLFLLKHSNHMFNGHLKWATK